MRWIVLVFFLVFGESYRISPSPFYYPVARESDLVSLSSSSSIQRVYLGNEPLVLYPSLSSTLSDKRYVVQSDVCPHMGAQLHQGWRSVHGGIHCPYHAFEFNENGAFCRIPNPAGKAPSSRRRPSAAGSKTCLDTYPVYLRDGYLFIPSSVREPVYRPGAVVPRRIRSQDAVQDLGPVLDVPFKPYFPPENKDPKFRVTEGSIEIPQYQDIVTENLLDMLHISYVHSFGSRLTPIPYEVQHYKRHDWGFRTRFLYSPNQNTISTEMGRVTTVIVENEFYMPSTTITRVIAGNIVKTVHTFTTPREGKGSTLYWRIYRNFWRDPFIPAMDVFGDVLITFLMNRTLEEDRSILSKIYETRRDSNFLTRYDVSIKKYREMMARFSTVGRGGTDDDLGSGGCI